MNASDPKNRRRRNAGVIAAICGGSAASSISLSAAGRHVDHGAHGLVWQDVGLAAGIVLIVVALVACIVVARRPC